MQSHSGFPLVLYQGMIPRPHQLARHRMLLLMANEAIHQPSQEDRAMPLSLVKSDCSSDLLLRLPFLILHRLKLTLRPFRSTIPLALQQICQRMSCLATEHVILIGQSPAFRRAAVRSDQVRIVQNDSDMITCLPSMLVTGDLLFDLQGHGAL